MQALQFQFIFWLVTQTLNPEEKKNLKLWGLEVCFMTSISGQPLSKTMPETWLSLCTCHCYAPAGSSSEGHIKVHSIKAVAVAGVCLRSLPSLGICRALSEVICVILCHISALILHSNDFRGANLYPMCLEPMMIQLSLSGLLQPFVCILWYRWVHFHLAIICT